MEKQLQWNAGKGKRTIIKLFVQKEEKSTFDNAAFSL